jgi:hypothetical protein
LADLAKLWWTSTKVVPAGTAGNQVYAQPVAGLNPTLSASKQKALYLQGLFVWRKKSLGSQIGSHEALMKLKHYLSLAPSGTWHFRQRVPADLIRVFGCRFLKRSLRTRDPLIAQRLALGMWEAVAEGMKKRIDAFGLPLRQKGHL